MRLTSIDVETDTGSLNPDLQESQDEQTEADLTVTKTAPKAVVAPPTQSDSRISKEVTVIGMSYVGLTLSAILSEVGFRVNGVDTNKNTIKNLNKKIVPFYEKDLRTAIISISRKRSGADTILAVAPRAQ